MAIYATHKKLWMFDFQMKAMEKAQATVMLCQESLMVKQKRAIYLFQTTNVLKQINDYT